MIEFSWTGAGERVSWCRWWVDGSSYGGGLAEGEEQQTKLVIDPLPRLTHSLHPQSNSTLSQHSLHSHPRLIPLNWDLNDLLIRRRRQPNRLTPSIIKTHTYGHTPELNTYSFKVQVRFTKYSYNHSSHQIKVSNRLKNSIDIDQGSNPPNWFMFIGMTDKILLAFEEHYQFQRGGDHSSSSSRSDPDLVILNTLVLSSRGQRMYVHTVDDLWIDRPKTHYNRKQRTTRSDLS